jgi:hypothetical protein
MDQIFDHAKPPLSNRKIYSTKDMLREELFSKKPLGVEMNSHSQSEQQIDNFVDEFEEIEASKLSEDKLRKVTGTSDLSSVTKLSIVVDSTKNSSFEEIGHLLPSLEQLQLDGSIFFSLRDLGTDLRLLQILSLVNVGLTELHGVSALPCLREFFLNRNHIFDLTPLCSHEALQILDLSENQIATIDSLEILGTCSKLYSLTLKGNLIEKALKAFGDRDLGDQQSSSSSSLNIHQPLSLKKKGYREVVVYHVNTLKVLDGTHLQFALVDASFIAEASTFLTLYATKHANLDEIEHEEEMMDNESSPWQQPLGHQKKKTDVDTQSKVAPCLLDDSSSLTQTTGLTFAGAPSSLLRNRRGASSKKKILISSSLNSLDNEQVLKGVEDERRLEKNNLQIKSKTTSHRRKKKHSLSSTSLDTAAFSEKRKVSNQSPSPTTEERDDAVEEEKEDRRTGGGNGLMDAWRASRPCSSDDALPRMRAFPPSESGLVGPASALSPDMAAQKRAGEATCFAPATSLSFETDTFGPSSSASSMMMNRPHSAHTSTPALVPNFLMMQDSQLDMDGFEPSCDDIDLSFKSAEKQFAGQRRRTKHRGRGWQNPLEFKEEKIFVAPDINASSWAIEKGSHRETVIKKKNSQSFVEENESSDSEDDDSQKMTRANLKARAHAMSSSTDNKVTPKKSGTKWSRRVSSFLNDNDDDDDDDKNDNKIIIERTNNNSKSEEESPTDSIKTEKTVARIGKGAGQLGFDIQLSLSAIDKWTDLSELSRRKQKKLVEAAQKKQKEASLLASKPCILSPSPLYVEDDVDEADDQDVTQALQETQPQVQPTVAEDLVRKSAVFREYSQQDVGVGVGMCDEDLVEMLKKPPKHVPELKTRDSFRNFFKGCCAVRMRSLLEQACEDEKKVSRRFELVKDVLL